MDARASRSGGGDTVTAAGLRQVLRAVWLLKEKAPSPERSDDVDRPASTPIDAGGAAEVASPSGEPEAPVEAFGMPKPGPPGDGTEIGRASGRERGCRYG